MEIQTDSLSKFIHGQHFSHGVRQGVGVIGIGLLGLFIFDDLSLAFVLGLGALASSIVDIPGGGTLKHRMNEMIYGSIMAALTVLITGVFNHFPFLIWIVAGAMVFFFSMLNVYGARGGVIGFVSLLMMIVNLYTIRPLEETLYQSALIFIGSILYIGFDYVVSRVYILADETKTLASALHSTADYIHARSYLFDTNRDLEESYRKVIENMSLMLVEHQNARDIMLKVSDTHYQQKNQANIRLWNIFIDMVGLLDTLVASKADYTMLRNHFHQDDILLFMRDIMLKLSRTLNWAAIALAQKKPINYRNSVRAEMKALEYDIEQLRKQNIATENPEIYSLCIQLLRRLRNATRLVDQIADNTRSNENNKIESALNPTNPMNLMSFSTNKRVSLKLFKDNLNLKSIYFRYSIRVTIAVTVIMLFNFLVDTFFHDQASIQIMTEHNYWIIMTLAVIMRPGYGSTRERTAQRLTGTILGCLAAIILFTFVSNTIVLFLFMYVCCVMGNSLAITHYRASTLFTTVFVLIGLKYVNPNILSIVGERAIDTLIASFIAFCASFWMPSWEKDHILEYAQKAIDNCKSYLINMLNYVNYVHDKQDNQNVQDSSQDGTDLLKAKELARKEMHHAFSEFAESFARMMNDPPKKQVYLIEYNNLLLQSDSLANQLTIVYQQLLNLKEIPPNMQQALNYIKENLNQNSVAIAPSNLEHDTPELLNLQFPLKQSMKSAELIKEELNVITKSD